MASRKPKLEKGETCSVGARADDGVTELVGTGIMFYVTPDTTVGPGTVLSIGHKVLVDFRREPVTLSRGRRGIVALRVRSYGPDPADLRELEQLLQRLQRAGDPRRWFTFQDLPWEDGDPFWLLVTPQQHDGLLRERIFK